jgi:hypothetical protein
VIGYFGKAVVGRPGTGARPSLDGKVDRLISASDRRQNDHDHSGKRPSESHGTRTSAAGEL